jgi:hypothetical protein
LATRNACPGEETSIQLRNRLRPQNTRVEWAADGHSSSSSHSNTSTASAKAPRRNNHANDRPRRERYAHSVESCIFSLGSWLQQGCLKTSRGGASRETLLSASFGDAFTGCRAHAYLCNNPPAPRPQVASIRQCVSPPLRHPQESPRSLHWVSRPTAL